MKTDINLFEMEDSIFLKKIKSKAEISKEDSCDGYLIESSESETRKIIESLKGNDKKIALIAGDDSFNRRAIETLKINYLVDVEAKTSFDTLKQRDSGLNHFLAKEAKRRGIKIVVDLNSLIRLDKKQKVKRISKIIQNVVICRKAKCDLKIASFSSSGGEIIGIREREAFGKSLGMDSLSAKKAVEFN